MYGLQRKRLLPAMQYELYGMRDIILQPSALSALHYSFPDGDSYILEKYQLTRLNPVQPSGRTQGTCQLNGLSFLSVPTFGHF